MSKSQSAWTLYMIRCGDGSLYTGITTDMARRLHEHQNENGSGRGAKFLRGRQPLTLVYQKLLPNRSEALRMEYSVKQLSKADKEMLVNKQMELPEMIARNTE